VQSGAAAPDEVVSDPVEKTEDVRAPVAREGRFAAAVYGSIPVTGLVGALAQQDVSAKATAVSLLSTTAVFWVAHVWSEILGQRLDTGRLLSRQRLKRLAAWGMIGASRMRARWPKALLVGALDGMLGLAIVGLEIAVH
jgi:hypothetical protein